MRNMRKTVISAASILAMTFVMGCPTPKDGDAGEDDVASEAGNPDADPSGAPKTDPSGAPTPAQPESPAPEATPEGAPVPGPAAK